jgi:hypothetical protein
LCASLSIRTERRENTGKLVETFDADLGLPECHACAVAVVEHPIRQLPAKVRPLARVDACQFLAASKRRDLQSPSEQRMPTISLCKSYATAAVKMPSRSKTRHSP